MSAKRTRLASRKIGLMLADGQLTLGSRLSDLTLSKQIGVSRTPVRCAIHELAEFGMVEFRPGQGAFIRLPERHRIEDLYDMRCLLEGHAAAIAAKRASPDAIDRLQRTCEIMSDATDRMQIEGVAALCGRLARRAIVNDTRFHVELARITGDRHLRRFVRRIRRMMEFYLRLHDEPSLDVLPLFIQTLADHRAIVAAIRARKPDIARDLTTKHLAGGRKTVLAMHDQLVLKLQSRSDTNP